MKKSLLTFITSLFFINAFSWGTDVLVGPLPAGKISIVSNAAGDLFCSIPSIVTGQAGVGLFQSTDQGATWSLLFNPAISSTVVKSKMVVTGTDSLYCIYQIGNNLFVYGFTGNTVTPFTLMTIDDFDIVASPNSNSLYLFCDDSGNGNIHRYSSSDGGFTWTGSTALVAGNGAHPRLCMSGTHLILNYYSPVINDTAASIIRSAAYSETAPAQIAPGTFVDLTQAGIHHNQFGSVIIDNKVWFIFTEGDATQTIKYILSSDNGQNYGIETVLAGNANLNAQCFDAIHYSDGTGSGIRIVYYTDSMQSNKQMQYVTATSANPGVFSTPEVISDFSALCAGEPTYPSITNMIGELGVVWVETDTTFTGTYFDKSSVPTIVSEINNESSIEVYPNPANTILNIRRTELLNQDKLLITDISGRLIKSIEIIHSTEQIAIDDLVPGIYFIHSIDGKTTRLVKQ